MKTATYIKHVEGFRGDARLYQLSEQLIYSDGRGKTRCGYVVVLACITSTGPETRIFPASASGHILGWEELPDSFTIHSLNHFKALTDAGYQVVDEIPF